MKKSIKIIIHIAIVLILTIIFYFLALHFFNASKTQIDLYNQSLDPFRLEASKIFLAEMYMIIGLYATTTITAICFHDLFWHKISRKNYIISLCIGFALSLVYYVICFLCLNTRAIQEFMLFFMLGFTIVYIGFSGLFFYRTNKSLLE